MAANLSEVRSVHVGFLCATLMGLLYFVFLRKGQIVSINPIVLSSTSHKHEDLLKHSRACSKTTDHHNNESTAVSSDKGELGSILAKVANQNKTIIMTVLNAAWAQNNSMLDLFLQSFRVGNGTEYLLKNLLIVCADNKALQRCHEIHKHCYQMKTPGVNYTALMPLMSDHYLKMMWRRVRFFGQVLELGYNLVFSDTDILWLRDPFMRFSPSADMHFASDFYFGHPYDLHNIPNCGFMHARSNEQTISFAKFWYQSRLTYPGKNEQDVLHLFKFQQIRQRCLKVIFLDTEYFRGYCQHNPDLSQVYTVHTNCCVGVETKLHDLRTTLSDWEKYMKHAKSQHGGNGVKDAMNWTYERACHYP